jgi:hypothetical protein
MVFIEKHRLALILLHGADMNSRRIALILHGPFCAPFCLRNAWEKFRDGVTDGRYVLVTEKIGA